jgi:hypothetical protein
VLAAKDHARVARRPERLFRRAVLSRRAGEDALPRRRRRPRSPLKRSKEAEQQGIIQPRRPGCCAGWPRRRPRDGRARRQVDQARLYREAPRRLARNALPRDRCQESPARSRSS